MPKDSFCPICSVYLRDPTVERCPKCKAFIKQGQEVKARIEADLKRKSEGVEGPFHAVIGKKCPLCGEEVEILAPQVEEFLVFGEVVGKGPKGDMRAPNKAYVGIQAWRCRFNHKLFSSFEVEWKECCPGCLDHNHTFGGLVRSCPKCKIMVPIGHYRKDDPLTMIASRDYHYAPELEERT